jgi:acyl-CoA thioesterase-1
VLIPVAAWLRVALLCAVLVAGSTAAARQGATILVLGDSLSAEYGLPRDTGWVRLLADRVAKEASQYSVVNASISGETTSGGRTRLPQLLQKYKPAIVVLQLGANDGLRGLPLDAMRENLASMVRASRDAGASVLLVGMRIPPNYGRQYSERFAGVYAQLAREEKVALVPFLLEGFADDLAYFQADRIHPTERAQPRMLDAVWPQLAPLLRRGRSEAKSPRAAARRIPAIA